MVRPHGKPSRNYASQFDKSDKKTQKHTNENKTELTSKAEGNLGPTSDFNRNHPSQLH